MSDRPKLPDLLVVLQDSISWSELKLLVPHLTSYDLFPLLTDIESDYQGKERYLHAFKAWLDRDLYASWEKVVSALRVISKNVLALEIEKKYCTPVGSIPQPLGGSPEVSEPSVLVPAADDVSCKLKEEFSEMILLLNHGRYGKMVWSIPKPRALLARIKVTLTTLPRIKKHPHLQFLLNEKQRIMRAEDVDGIFDILDPYWNYEEYELLECLIRRFGTRDLKKRMKRYITKLRRFKRGAVAVQKCRLENGFLDAVVDTKVCLLEQEAKSESFLPKLKVALTTLPHSERCQHLLFLKEEKDRIMQAADIDDIFDILDPHWNCIDYSLLEYLINKFGTSELRQKMKKYIATLEKETRVRDSDVNESAMAH